VISSKIPSKFAEGIDVFEELQQDERMISYFCEKNNFESKMKIDENEETTRFEDNPHLLDDSQNLIRKFLRLQVKKYVIFNI